MGGTGGQQAQPHDVVLLRRPLAQVRKVGVLRAQIEIDAGDEQHQQACRQQEADEHALNMELEQPKIRLLGRQLQLAIGSGQPEIAAAGHRNQDPGGPRLQQHRAQGDLQQVQGNEGIGGAPAEIELGRQGRDVEHQLEKQLGIRHRPRLEMAQHADQVEPD
jgi:hypothetical protein